MSVETRRELLDRSLVRAIDAALRVGDHDTAATLRLERLAYAIQDWRYADDATAARQRDEHRRRRAVARAVRRYEQAQVA